MILLVLFFSLFNATMNQATENIVDYMYENENIHFLEWIEEEDYKNKVVFMTKLKTHIFYSVIVLKFKGNMQEIDDWCENYWEEHKDTDEDIIELK